MAHVTLRRDGSIATLTVDRPPANALDVVLLGEIVAAARELESAPPAALVLAGREGFFSAGADLKAISGYGLQEQRQMVERINAMTLSIYALPCPVVGAITGHAIAGGMVLALTTDVRVASRAGRYGLTEVQVGVAYPQAAIGVVRAELSPSAARFLVLSNRLIDAEECTRLGVFDEALDPDAVVPRALELAGELAAFPPDDYARAKSELRAAATRTIELAAATDPLLERWVG